MAGSRFRADEAVEKFTLMFSPEMTVLTSKLNLSEKEVKEFQKFLKGEKFDLKGVGKFASAWSAAPPEVKKDLQRWEGTWDGEDVVAHCPWFDEIDKRVSRLMETKEKVSIYHTQVNPKAGFTFATAMKAFLRADPDIIMVGEMRDKDTTSIGIEASLTGHLVFATLHTNSAPESIIRLLDMGMDPFNFADALLGILAQRLAKRLCKCKEAYTPDQTEVKHFITEYCSELVNTAEFKKDLQSGYKKVFERFQKDYGFGKPDFKLYKPKGCDACGGSGYKGRVGLHEMLVGTDPLKKMIQEHARVAEMLALALEDGMLTLKMDGMEKVLQGITDMAQVRAVCIK